MWAFFFPAGHPMDLIYNQKLGALGLNNIFDLGSMTRAKQTTERPA